MDYNPFLPEVKDNPYPYYAYLRRHAPVYQIEGVGMWAITRYDDVLYALKNPQLFSSAMMVGLLLPGDLNPDPETPWFIALDPPAHTRVRMLVNRAFTPRRVASLELHIREVARQLIEQIARKEECDLVADLAAPLPVIVIAELLGVEPERRQDFRRWGDALVHAGGGQVTAEERTEVVQGTRALYAYFEHMVAARRREPREDLVSALIRAEEEEQRLTAKEVLSIVTFLLMAGSETTTNLISNAVLALLEHPEELTKVRANPSLILNMVEEVLRYDAPVQSLVRQTTREVELAGTRIPAGAVVMPLYGAANRDERRFPEPDRFDVTRDAQGHLAFGFGIHFCLGAPLARLEARVALEGLLVRFPRLSRNGEYTRIDTPLFRGLKTFPLVVQ